MGAIRKTMSVTTLGLVPFRSKKEKIQRAERASELAELELKKEQEARAEADRRVALADERARAAEHLLVREAKALRSRSRGARAERKASEAGSRVSGAVEGLVDRATGAVVSAAGSAQHDTKRAAKRAAKHARKDAKRLGKLAKHDTKRAAKHARKDAKRLGKRARSETAQLTEPAKKRAKAGVTTIRRRARTGTKQASEALDGAVERAEALVDS